MQGQNFVRLLVCAPIPFGMKMTTVHKVPVGVTLIGVSVVDKRRVDLMHRDVSNSYFRKNFLLGLQTQQIVSCLGGAPFSKNDFGM